MGVGGQVPPGDERAHVDVMGEDIMADLLAEKQHQVGELHSLALIARLGWERNQEERGGGGVVLQVHKKKKILHELGLSVSLGIPMLPCALEISNCQTAW